MLKPFERLETGLKQKDIFYLTLYGEDMHSVRRQSLA